MKNFQSLTLLMMAVMVYTKAIHNGKLEEIHRCAEKLNKLTKNETIMVAKISSNKNGPCVTEFFCLAEKVLENATDLFKNETEEAINTMKRLKRALIAYNKEPEHVHNCTLNTTEEHRLKIFLEDVMKCSSHKKKKM